MTEPKTELEQNHALEVRRKLAMGLRMGEDMHWLNSRMASSRMNSRLAQIEREKAMEKAYQETTDHAAIVNDRAAKEAALAIEIQQLKRADKLEQVRRQILHERDPEIRELVKSLRNAYLCRDLRKQIADNEFKKIEDKVENLRKDEYLKNALYNDHEIAMKEDEEQMMKKTAYCRDLQQQLGNDMKRKQCLYENTLIEKKMLDDILKTIYDEDIKQLEEKKDQMAKTKQEMQTFQAARDAWRQKQKLLIIQEARDIEAYEKKKQEQSSNLSAEKDRIMKIKDELNKTVIEEMMVKEAAKLDRENLITSLDEQEHLEKLVQDDISQKQKAEQIKMANKKALEDQMALRKEIQLKALKADIEYRVNMEKKKEEEDKKERDKEKAKIAKRKQYAIELRQQIKQNAVARKQRDTELLERNADVFKQADNWKEQVEQERKKIIEEHAPHVLGYMQAGVLQTRDIPVVGAGANKYPHLAPLNVEAMDNPKKKIIHSKCNLQCKELRLY